MHLRLWVAIIFFGWFSLAPAGIIDDFNRPDANTLGPNWTVVAGGAMITGNRAAALNNTQYPNMVVYSGLTASSAFVDVYSVGNDLQYVALVLGYSSASANYFIKVQNQDWDTSFERYAFYFGNNGGGLFAYLSQPFASGRISATFSGNTAYLYIDTNFDGIPEQVYSHTYATPVTGSGVGLGFYGAAQADNFGVGEFEMIPEPGSWALVTLGLGALGLLRHRRK